MPIPLIDMSLPEAEAAAALRYACEEFGFFYLKNHGVPAADIEAMFRESRRFFATSLELKMRVVADKNNRGFTPMGEETLDPAQQSEGDTKEGYYIGKHSTAPLPLHGPNQWPEHVPSFQPAMEVYFDALVNLGHRTARLVALALELDADFFAQKGRCDDPMVFLRLLRYAPRRSEPSAGVYGCGAHTDYGMLTFLVTDDVPGLEIWREGRWLSVPKVPGCFVVNLGDMLQRWTNDAWQATRHRVVNRLGLERFSTPFFWEPNFDCRVECVSTCVHEQWPARYAPITSGQFLLDKYRSTHANFKE